MKVEDSSQIVYIYNINDSVGKVRTVLDNYPTFLNMVNVYEFGLINKIREERVTNRRISRGELGVRVQTSNQSNPTSTEGDERDEISNAVKAGDYITALRGADDFDLHRAEILSLKNMREDYALVCRQFGAVGDDGKLLERYLSHELDLITIADSEGVTLEAIKQRFKKAKKKIIKGCVRWIHESEEYFVMEKGA